MAALVTKGILSVGDVREILRPAVESLSRVAIADAKKASVFVDKLLERIEKSANLGGTVAPPSG